MKNIFSLFLFLFIFILSLTVKSQEHHLNRTINFKKSFQKSALTKEKTKSDIDLRKFGQKSQNQSLNENLEYSWAKRLSTSNNDRFYDIIIDGNKNIITVGAKSYSSFDYDGVIFKFNSEGDLLWDDSPADGTGFDGIYGVSKDGNDNIFITGTYENSAFDGVISSNGENDGFIAKYSSNGTLEWVKSFGGEKGDYGCGVDTDEEGNVYIAGFFNGTAYWDDITKTSSDYGDMFISKYDKDGNIQWVKQGDIGDESYLVGIVADSDGNSYVSAHYYAENRFDGSDYLISEGSTDIFLIKYDTNGAFQWIATAGGELEDGGNDIDIDGDGNLLIAGYFSGNAQFGNINLTSHGEYDIFCAKYSPDGNLIWVKQFGGSGSQSAWGVTADQQGNSYLTGWFSGTGAFDNTTIVSKGGQDAYIIKYDRNGNLEWVNQTATGFDKQVSGGIDVLENDIAISGYYEGDLEIGGIEFPYSEQEDAFIAKFTQTGSSNQNTYIYPTLRLSHSAVEQGQSLYIFGQQFSPLGKIDIVFTGPENIAALYDYLVDINGEFEYYLELPEDIEAGEYLIAVKDKINDLVITKKFIVEETRIEADYLKILQPNQSKERFVDEPIAFSWEDMANLDYSYLHSYSVQYQKDSESWKTIKQVENSNLGYGLITETIEFIPSEPGEYKLKVTDNFNASRYKITPAIWVTESVYSGKIEFKWDKSYDITPDISPVGAAADGVGRFFMVVTNDAVGSRISSIKVSLSDESGSDSPQFLGKVMYCSQQNDNFSDEANDASSTVAHKESDNADDKYWFWYVAPDDFARGELDFDKGERSVLAKFEMSLSNGEQYTIEKEIIIVRPPLMLVHGLVGDPSTWDYFPTKDTEILFINDTRFKSRRAVAVSPDSHFDINSNLLLDSNFEYYLELPEQSQNSFMSLIFNLRNQGYACNQLDYVCHSMGGVIFRDAVEKSNSYYRRIVNYGAGFANKFISLHTPHDGSSYANFLVDIDNDPIGKNWYLQGEFGKRGLFECKYLSCNVVGAIQDLRFLDGVKFDETEVPSHLIGSGVNCYKYPQKTIETLLKVMGGTNKLDKNDPCSSLDEYFTNNGFEDYFAENNDAIVSARSQFSGIEINTLSAYKNCTWFDNYMHNSDFGDSPTRSAEVGARVDFLLNSDANSDLFDYIPATKTDNKSEIIKKNEFATVVEDKIQIVSPQNFNEFNTGDSISIKIELENQDLEHVALLFQGNTIIETPTKSNVEFNFIVGDEHIEKQSINALARYNNGEEIILAEDFIEVIIHPVESINDFMVEPEILVIEKGHDRRPSYTAIFPSSIAEVGETDLINVSIKDSELIEYNENTNKFKGLNAGNTSATVTYRGISKTIFLQVVEYQEPPVDPPVGNSEIEINKNIPIDVEAYPNPFTDEFTLEFSLTNGSEIQIEIFDIMGKKIKSVELRYQPGGKHSTVINLKNSPKGIYVYKFLSKYFSKQGQLVKN